MLRHQARKWAWKTGNQKAMLITVFSVAVSFWGQLEWGQIWLNNSIIYSRIIQESGYVMPQA